jgi:hypothetical protein
MDFMLLVIMAKSSAYAAEFSVYCDVLSLYPRLSCSSHLSRGSRNMIKRYGLSVSPYMVLLCMCTGFVLPKYVLVNIVDEFE